MHITRRKSLALLAAVPVASPLFVGPALAAQPPVFATGGVAINGYDAVAYFTDAKPVKGAPEFSHDWNGATWQFASAANRDAFAAEPQAYAPQFGGYCAYAVSKGYTATTEPDAWTVHEGRLYLNYNLTVRDIWSEDIPGNIRLATANWPGVLDT